MNAPLSETARGKELDGLIERGASSEEIVTFCRAAIEEAATKNDDAERVYISGRLADALQRGGEAAAAASVYGSIWPGQSSSVLYGFQYLKVLLQIGRVREAEEVVPQMQRRLQEESAERSRISVIGQLMVLLAEGLVEVRRSNLARVVEVCEQITRLGDDEPWLPYVDPTLLSDLMVARQYDLARQLLEFTARVSPSGRPSRSQGRNR